MKLTDEEIDECYEVAIRTFKRSKGQVRGQQLTPSDDFNWHFARAIEAAVAERCAKVCDDLARAVSNGNTIAIEQRKLCAEAIRGQA